MFLKTSIISIYFMDDDDDYLTNCQLDFFYVKYSYDFLNVSKKKKKTSKNLPPRQKLKLKV